MKTWICRAALLTALCFWAMPVSVHAEDGYTLFAIEKGSDENIRNAYVVIDGKTGETESVAEEEASAGADTDAGEASSAGADTAAGEEDDAGEASSAGADTAAGEEDDAGTTADVGGAANAKDNPSTGDFSLPEKLFFLLILSGTAVCGLLTKRTRKKKRRFN